MPVTTYWVDGSDTVAVDRVKTEAKAYSDEHQCDVAVRDKNKTRRNLLEVYDPDAEFVKIW